MTGPDSDVLRRSGSVRESACSPPVNFTAGIFYDGIVAECSDFGSQLCRDNELQAQRLATPSTRLSVYFIIIAKIRRIGNSSRTKTPVRVDLPVFSALARQPGPDMLIRRYPQTSDDQGLLTGELQAYYNVEKAFHFSKSMSVFKTFLPGEDRLGS